MYKRQIHDPEAAIDYAHRLKAAADRLNEDLLVVMRVYFEKSRTTVDWKGLINDPDLDSSFKTDKGLHMAREVFIEILRAGLSAGTEFLGPNSLQYIVDAVSWGAIGARTTESRARRQLASRLFTPIGFKDGTDGSVRIAVDSLVSAASPYFFFSMNDQGRATAVEAAGDHNCHLTLRGGISGPNQDGESLSDTEARLNKSEQTVSIMVDASHTNSGKSGVRQAEAAEEPGKLIRGSDGRIIDIMMESFLEVGAQKITDSRKGLVYGKSVIDACMGWEATDRLLCTLAAEARKRRQARD